MSKPLIKVSALLVIITINLSFRHSEKKVVLNLKNPLNDSIEVLVNSGGLVMGIANPPTKEETRLWNILKSLYSLNYEQREEMIKHWNPYVSLYGLSLVANSSMHDSIIGKDYPILHDTTEIKFHGLREIPDRKFTAKEIALMMMKSARDNKEYENKLPKVKKAIENFIKKYTSLPDSYQSISFSEESSSGVEDEVFYEFKHFYYIKSNKEKRDTVSHYFILDKNLKMNQIESIRSNTLSSQPPNLREWLKDYGKELNKRDSTNLLLNMVVDLPDYFD